MDCVDSIEGLWTVLVILWAVGSWIWQAIKKSNQKQKAQQYRQPAPASAPPQEPQAAESINLEFLRETLRKAGIELPVEGQPEVSASYDERSAERARPYDPQSAENARAYDQTATEDRHDFDDEADEDGRDFDEEAQEDARDFDAADRTEAARGETAAAEAAGPEVVDDEYWARKAAADRAARAAARRVTMPGIPGSTDEALATDAAPMPHALIHDHEAAQATDREIWGIKNLRTDGIEVNPQTVREAMILNALFTRRAPPV